MEIKEVVKEKYGQAALRVQSGWQFVLRSRRRAGLTAAILSPRICMTPSKPAHCRKRRCWPRSAVAIPRR